MRLCCGCVRLCEAVWLLLWGVSFEDPIHPHKTKDNSTAQLNGKVGQSEAAT